MLVEFNTFRRISVDPDKINGHIVLSYISKLNWEFASHKGMRNGAGRLINYLHRDFLYYITANGIETKVFGSWYVAVS